MSKKRDFFYPKSYLLHNLDVQVTRLSRIHRFLEHKILEDRTNCFSKTDDRCFCLESNAQRNVVDNKLLFQNNFLKAQYSQANPDVKMAKIDPLEVHYVEYGSKERRQLAQNQQLVKFVVCICKTFDKSKGVLSILDFLDHECPRMKDQFDDIFSDLNSSIKFFSKPKLSIQSFKFVTPHKLFMTDSSIGAINLSDEVQKETPFIFDLQGGGFLDLAVKNVFDDVIISLVRMRQSEQIFFNVCKLLNPFTDIGLTILNSIINFELYCKKIQVLFMQELTYSMQQFIFERFRSSADMIVFSKKINKKSFEKVANFVRTIQLTNRGKSDTHCNLFKKYSGEILLSKGGEKSDISTEELCRIYIKFAEVPKNSNKKASEYTNLVGFVAMGFNTSRNNPLTFILNNRLKPFEAFRKFAFS